MTHRIALLFACSVLLIACATDRSEPAAARSDAEVDAEVARLRGVVEGGGGDADRGKSLFAQRCGACHTLHGQGGQVGPDLTPYLRDPAHLDFILRSVVTPTALVHEYHPTVVARTRSGVTHVGTVISESPEQIMLATPGGGRVVLPRGEVASIEARTESLMPAQTLAGLTDAEVRDLFAYILRR